MNDIDETVLQDLYAWVDAIPMSRPKKNIARDFSDGVLMAEVVKHYFPKLIELHSYPSCSAVNQKKKNWHLLNWKAFKKMNFELSDDVIVNLVDAKPGTVERVLLLVRSKMDRMLFSKTDDNSSARATDSRRKIFSDDNSNNNRQDFQYGSNRENLPSRDALEQCRQNCAAKDETIEILQVKIRKLEHLLELKDLRINDLQKRMGESATSSTNKYNYK